MSGVSGEILAPILIAAGAKPGGACTFAAGAGPKGGVTTVVAFAAMLGACRAVDLSAIAGNNRARRIDNRFARILITGVLITRILIAWVLIARVLITGVLIARVLIRGALIMLVYISIRFGLCVGGLKTIAVMVHIPATTLVVVADSCRFGIKGAATQEK